MSDQSTSTRGALPGDPNCICQGTGLTCRLRDGGPDPESIAICDCVLAKLNTPQHQPSASRGEALPEGKRGVLFRQRHEAEGPGGGWGPWSSWKVAELGIPSLLAKADRDDYQVEEVISVASAAEAFDRVVAERDALGSLAKGREGAEMRLGEVEELAAWLVSDETRRIARDAFEAEEVRHREEPGPMRAALQAVADKLVEQPPVGREEAAGHFENLARRFDALKKDALEREEKFRAEEPEYPGWAAGEAGAAEAFEEAASILRAQPTGGREEALREALEAEVERLNLLPVWIRPEEAADRLQAILDTNPSPASGGGAEQHSVEQIAACLEEALGGPQFKHDVRVVYVRMLAEKMVEFDAWLSFRGEFGEVLRAFRDAFGTDTSAAAMEATTKKPEAPDPCETIRVERYGHDHIWHTVTEHVPAAGFGEQTIKVRRCGYDHCGALSIQRGDDPPATYLPASFDNACLHPNQGSDQPKGER